MLSQGGRGACLKKWGISTMTKALLITAAALLYAGSAYAGSHVISFDGYCDTYTIKTQDSKKVLSSSSQNTGCDDNGGIGGVAKAGGALYAVIGANIPSTGDLIWKVKLSYPLATGGTWELDSSTDGLTFTFINSGTYTVDSAGVHGGKPATAGR